MKLDTLKTQGSHHQKVLNLVLEFLCLYPDLSPDSVLSLSQKVHKFLFPRDVAYSSVSFWITWGGGGFVFCLWADRMLPGLFSCFRWSSWRQAVWQVQHSCISSPDCPHNGQDCYFFFFYFLTIWYVLIDGSIMCLFSSFHVYKMKVFKSPKQD